MFHRTTTQQTRLVEQHRTWKRQRREVELLQDKHEAFLDYLQTENGSQILASVHQKEFEAYDKHKADENKIFI